MNSLYENLVNGIITQEEYQEMRKSYGDKISDTMKNITEVENRRLKLEKSYNRYCDLSNAAQKLGKSLWRVVNNV